MQTFMIQKRCEHAGPMVTTTHEGNATKDDLEIYSGWWSQRMLKDHIIQRNIGHMNIARRTKIKDFEESETTS